MLFQSLPRLEERDFDKIFDIEIPKITDLFPTLNDFFKFVQENPKSFKVTVQPKNFEEIKQKIESVGGKLVPTDEITTTIYT